MHTRLAIFYHAPSDNVRRIVDALIDGKPYALGMTLAAGLEAGIF